MDNVLMLMIGVSIFLAFIAVMAFIWAIKSNQFSDNNSFLELNDSEEALKNAIILEERKKALKDSKKALFLDRDGVINIDYSYVYKLSDLAFIDGIFKLAKHFYDKGYLIIIITNQSGINRGYYSENDMHSFNNAIKDEFLKQGIKISNVYFCPHTPDENCECRKPKTALIKAACKDFNIDLVNSIFVGDKLSDMQTAMNANIKNRYLFSKNQQNTSDEYKIITKLTDIIKDSDERC